MKRFLISTLISIAIIAIIATAYAVATSDYRQGYTFLDKMTELFCHWGYTTRAIMYTPVLTGLICGTLSYCEYDDRKTQKRYDEKYSH